MKYKWLLAALQGTSLGKKFSLAKKYLLDRKKVDPILKCALCPNNCRFSCPIALIDAKETTSPAGKSRIGYLLKNNKLEWSEDTVYPLFYCLACEICKFHCDFEYSQLDLHRALRREAIERRVAPKGILDYVDNFRILRQKNDAYSEYVRDGDILVYLGCCYDAKSAVGSLMDILEGLGYRPYVLEEEIVIDNNPYYFGLDDKAGELVEALYELLRKHKTIVTPSIKTLYAIRKIMPEITNKKLKILHITELILENTKRIKQRTTEEYVIHENPKLLTLTENPLYLEELCERLNIRYRVPPRHASTAFPAPTKSSPLALIDEKLVEKIRQSRIRELEELGTPLVFTIEDVLAIENSKPLWEAVGAKE